MSPIQKYFRSVQQGRSAIHHWFLGLVSIIAGYLLFADGLSKLIFEYGMSPISSDSPNFELVIYAFLLMTFLPIFFGIWLVQKFWHNRSLTQLLTYTAKFRWRYFWNTAGVFIGMMAIASAISFAIWPEDWSDYQRNTNWTFVVYGGLITLLLVPFQAASEEFFLRGYLNQALIKYLKSPWVVFFLTSAAFALLHIWNSEAEGQMILYLTSIFIFGFGACVLLYFEGGLESAISLHIINNIFAFGILGYEDPILPTTALYFRGPPEIGLKEVAFEIVFLTLTITAILWVNRRSAKSKPSSGAVDICPQAQ